MRKHEALFGIATVHPMAVTTVGTKQQQKCYNQVFFWPSIFKDAYEFMRCCDKCQRTGGISRRNEMPLQNIMEVEIFDCWGIDFMGPLPSSYRNVYILVAMDYVSKWVEAIATPKDNARVVIKFLKKNIFSRFGVPRALISDGGTHFYNNQLRRVLEH